MPCKCLRTARALREVSIDDRNGYGGKAMNTETRMTIKQSTPMPQLFESRVSVRYETKVFSLWDRQAWAEVAHAFTYEITWMPELQCWRTFLCAVSKVA